MGSWTETEMGIRQCSASRAWMKSQSTRPLTCKKVIFDQLKGCELHFNKANTGTLTNGTNAWEVLITPFCKANTGPGIGTMFTCSVLITPFCKANTGDEITPNRIAELLITLICRLNTGAKTICCTVLPVLLTLICEPKTGSEPNFLINNWCYSP